MPSTHAYLHIRPYSTKCTVSMVLRVVDSHHPPRTRPTCVAYFRVHHTHTHIYEHQTSSNQPAIHTTIFVYNMFAYIGIYLKMRSKVHLFRIQINCWSLVLWLCRSFRTHYWRKYWALILPHYGIAYVWELRTMFWRFKFVTHTHTTVYNVICVEVYIRAALLRTLNIILSDWAEADKLHTVNEFGSSSQSTIGKTKFSYTSSH